MSEYWKLNPAHWREGTAGLSEEQRLAYLEIINWTHLADQPPRADDRSLCEVLRINQSRRARRIIGELCDIGKLFIKNGRVHNRRADEELAYRASKSRRKRAKDRPAKEPETEEPKRETIGDSYPIVGNYHPIVGNYHPNAEHNSLKTNGAASKKTDKRIEENISNKKKENIKRKKKPEQNPDFETFMAVYPKRQGDSPRKPALKSYEAAIAAGAQHADIMQGVGAFAALMKATGKERTEFIPHAATWLNQERWKNDYSQGSGITDEDRRRAEARRRLEEASSTDNNSDH